MTVTAIESHFNEKFKCNKKKKVLLGKKKKFIYHSVHGGSRRGHLGGGGLVKSPVGNSTCENSLPQNSPEENLALVLL